MLFENSDQVAEALNMQFQNMSVDNTMPIPRLIQPGSWEEQFANASAQQVLENFFEGDAEAVNEYLAAPSTPVAECEASKANQNHLLDTDHASDDRSEHQEEGHGHHQHQLTHQEVDSFHFHRCNDNHAVSELDTKNVQ